MNQIAFGSVLQEDVFYIPVIFHVVYANKSVNISKEQIDSQLIVLNQDFTASNTDLDQVDPFFEDYIGNADIRFVYADKIIGETIDAIRRIPTSIPVFNNIDLFKSLQGGVDPINPERYLNIWVSDLAEGLIGFHADEGVAIDYRGFGTTGTANPPYHLGRTLTHEIGHLFSLRHLWGLGGCESDDGIEDTPLQADAISSCKQESSSCSSRDMLQNFMNLAEDECLLFFTKGQVARMRQYIQTSFSNMIFSGENIVLGIDDDLVSAKLNLFPNPSTNGFFQIHSSQITGRVVVHTLDGKMIDELSSHNDQTLNLTHLKSGTYLITLINQDKIFTEKIIVK